ncbi:hypothetical protein C0995_010569 [Termitomyces sp. Mi166|nr:hypothetical protein C0995_010569 [Termitomyces sp. Mi166\
MNLDSYKLVVPPLSAGFSASSSALPKRDAIPPHVPLWQKLKYAVPPPIPTLPSFLSSSSSSGMGASAVDWKPLPAFELTELITNAKLGAKAQADQIPPANAPGPSSQEPASPSPTFQEPTSLLPVVIETFDPSSSIWLLDTEMPHALIIKGRYQHGYAQNTDVTEFTGAGKRSDVKFSAEVEHTRRWALLHHGGVHMYEHHDTEEQGTFVEIPSGAKMWAVVRPANFEDTKSKSEINLLEKEMIEYVDDQCKWYEKGKGFVVDC